MQCMEIIVNDLITQVFHTLYNVNYTTFRIRVDALVFFYTGLRIVQYIL